MTLPNLPSKFNTTISQLENYNLVDATKTNLAPLAELEELQAIISNYKIPAGKEFAAKWAKLLIGAYPARQMNDPEIFARSVVMDIFEFPEFAIENAIHQIRRNCKFLPTCAEIRAECKNQVRELDILERRINLQRIGHNSDKLSLRSKDAPPKSVSQVMSEYQIPMIGKSEQFEN